MNRRVSNQSAFDVLILGEKEIERQILAAVSSSKRSVETRFAGDPQAYEQILSETMPAVVVLDLEARNHKPFKLLSVLFKNDSPCDVVVLTRKPNVDSIVKCMKLGVTEFVQLPQESYKLLDFIKREFDKWHKMQSGTAIRDDQRSKYDFENIVAGSPGMREVIGISRKVFKRPWVTVLVRGETGTGKEVIARCIHYGTKQTKEKPFVEVNCTAIPENLLEAELFGYEKGAFTDAKFSKKGLFEMADGGTLFLDEIGDMNLSIQAKILKAIEEKRFRRLGGTTDIDVTLRIIAGTNADLEQKVQSGEFRTDLYYRLNVINIHLPPLQERGDDIIALANFFLERFSKTYGIARRQLSESAQAMLSQYDWPGNVRELQHVIERVVVLGDDPNIGIDEINKALGIKSQEIALPQKNGTSWKRAIEIPRDGLSLKEGEMRLISEVLRITKGNKTQASKILGISRPRLNRKIDEYQISLGAG